MLDLNVMTVTGRTLGENLEDVQRNGFFERGEGFLANYGLNREEVIRPAARGKGYGSIAVLRGNIAPDGAVVKFSAVQPDMLTHEGPARVFNHEEAALDAVLKGRIVPGAVIVIRYEGPRGSGMPEILATTEALMTNPELVHAAIITDARFSGATRGPCIGHVCPEAVTGGPIALIEDDDLIAIDIPGRSLDIIGHKDVRLTPQEIEALLAERRERWAPPDLGHPPGILKRYAKQAVSAIKGAYVV
jgi:dihydroxy-acid dehydratase